MTNKTRISVEVLLFITEMDGRAKGMSGGKRLMPSDCGNLNWIL